MSRLEGSWCGGALRAHRSKCIVRSTLTTPWTRRQEKRHVSVHSPELLRWNQETASHASCIVQEAIDTSLTALIHLSTSPPRPCPPRRTLLLHRPPRFLAADRTRFANAQPRSCQGSVESGFSLLGMRQLQYAFTGLIRE